MEVHAIMRRYVVACGEYVQALRAAGVVVPSVVVGAK
jgi:hypothetical protein